MARKITRALTHAFSDSETFSKGHFYTHVNSLPTLPEDGGYRYNRLNSLDGNQTGSYSYNSWHMRACDHFLVSN